jgi:branched-chain amino acid transport system ATP-binding protein
MTEGTLLQACGLYAAYGDTTVLEGVDLEVRRGEIVALLGPNGGWKTTTLMTLAGELACRAGEVRWHGVPTTEPLYKRVRAGLGLVAENRTVLMNLTVEENLRVGRGDRALALGLFPELEEHLRRRVGLLSGGQQQMLSLARALSRRPDVLLADELSLGLAPLVVNRLLAAIHAAADEGTAVLLAEKHIHKALETADRVVVLQQGRIALTEEASALRGRVARIEQLYFGTNERPATS